MDIIKAIQQMLQNYGQKNPQQAMAIANAGQPVLNAVQQGAKNLSNVNIPGANANIPSAVQSAFPITQVPAAVQGALRSQGRIASNTATPLDYLGSAATLAGIAVPEIMGALKGVPESTMPKATPITAPGIPKTSEALPADIAKTPEAQTPYAGWPPHIRAAKLESAGLPASPPPLEGNPNILQKIGQTVKQIGGKIGMAQKNPIVPLLEGFTGYTLGHGLLTNLTGAAIAEGRQVLGMNNDVNAAGAPLTPQEQAKADMETQKKIDTEVPNPFAAGTVDTLTGITKKLADLQAEQGSPAYSQSRTFDPAQTYANAVDAQVNALQTQMKAQQTMRDNYTVTSALDAQYNNVIKALDGNTSLLNRNDWYNILQKNNVPAYNALQGLLTALTKQGEDITNITGVNGKSALANLNGLKTQMLENYKSAYKTYGETPMTQSVDLNTTTANPVLMPSLSNPSGVQSVPPPTSPPSGQMFRPLTGGGGGLPKAGPKGLPPLQPNGLPMKPKIQIPPRYMYR